MLHLFHSTHLKKGLSYLVRQQKHTENLALSNHQKILADNDESPIFGSPPSRPNDLRLLRDQFESVSRPSHKI